MQNFQSCPIGPKTAKVQLFIVLGMYNFVFRHLLRFLHNFNTTTEDHERHSPYGIKYLQRSIQKYPICQEEINQFIEYFIEKSSDDEVAKNAMITFKASISINKQFKSFLQFKS